MRFPRHSPAASLFMGTVLLVIGFALLALTWAERDAGVAAVMAGTAAAYFTLHGTFLALTARDEMTIRKALVIVGVMIAIGYVIAEVFRSSDF